MWIAVFFLGVGACIGHAFYFSARVSRALDSLAPRTRPWLRGGRIAYRVVACSMPTLMLIYGIYMAIARPSSFRFMESAVLDYLLVYPFWLVTIYSFQCTLWIVPMDLIHWLLRKVGVARSARWIRRRDVLVLVVAGVFAVFVPVRIALDAGSLEVREHRVEVSGLPAGTPPIVVGLIADPQADRYTGAGRIGEMVGLMGRNSPDIVLIAGDIITREPTYTEVAARQLGKLTAPLGVYSCVGDHENFSYRDRERSVREVREGLAKYGIPLIDNEVVALTLEGGTSLSVAFVTNNYVSRIDEEGARKLLTHAASADVAIAIAHQTSDGLLEVARAAGVDLFLAGHTHGGQINFFLPFFDLSAVRVETRYVSGLFRIGGMPLVVSNGLGTSVAPFRYRAAATVDVIRLVPKS